MSAAPKGCRLPRRGCIEGAWIYALRTIAGQGAAGCHARDAGQGVADTVEASLHGIIRHLLCSRTRHISGVTGSIPSRQLAHAALWLWGLPLLRLHSLEAPPALAESEVAASKGHQHQCCQRANSNAGDGAAAQPPAIAGRRIVGWRAAGRRVAAWNN